jgi:1,6-anhydro-N-acetylmuramate kinase
MLRHEHFSINSKAKEAIALAIIANDSIAGLNTNIPGATGGRPTVLGKISV